MTKLGAFFLAVTATFICAEDFHGEMTDPRDGHVYKTIKVGNLEWMAENMNFKSHESRCYAKVNDNCEKYGRLYSWDDAVSKACPEGWFLPSSDDFKTLIATVGGEKTAGYALKARSGWLGDGSGLDAYGFAALPGGELVPQGIGGAGTKVAYENERKSAGFWSSDNMENVGVAVLRLTYFNKGVEFGERRYKTWSGFSVRCVKGSSFGSVDREGRSYRAVKIGEQVWMAENMKENVPGSVCYENDSLNCEKYGRLYTWDAAMTVCPTGWRLPTSEDFFKLRIYAYNNNGVEYGDVGYSLKSRDYWNGPDYQLPQTTDSYGFNALPAGRVNKSGGFMSLGSATSFWTSTKDSEFGPIGWHLDSFEDTFQGNTDGASLSVRCIKDN